MMMMRFIILCYCAGYCWASEGVTLVEDRIDLAWATSTPYRESDDYNPRRQHALFAVPGSQRDAGTRSWQRLILENAHLRLEIFPEAGGPVGRAIHKDSQSDLFFWEGASKDWLPFWESGVKASFPYREHGVPTIGAPVSWDRVDNPDGSITIGMWQEFSRNIEPWQRSMFGRYSSMVLSQLVTLRPDEATFSVLYRVTNAAPYRQGRQFWCDALFPRYHGPAGVTQGGQSPSLPDDARLIIPCAWISDHWGKNLRPWSETMRHAGSWTHNDNSVFAWTPDYGFAGVYYPRVDVNRLRITDPQQAPGAKLYLKGTDGWRERDLHTRHMHNFVEIWGGSDVLFESVSEWIQPGCAALFPYRYGLVGGIGEVVYADDDFAVGRRGDDLIIAAWRPLTEVRVSLAELRAEGAIDPQRPLVLAQAAQRVGRLQIQHMSGTTSFDWPTQVSRDTGGHHAIIVIMSDPLLGERFGEMAVHGQSLTENFHKIPAGSVAKGRQCYRLGRLEDAMRHLDLALQDDSTIGEAHYLRGLVDLERGRLASADGFFAAAIDAAEPYPYALWLRAIIAAGTDRREALKYCESLLATDATCWEAALLRAGLLIEVDAERAAEVIETLATVDPADPRLAWLRSQQPSASSADEERAVRLLNTPGATRRLAEFQAALAGRFLPGLRIGDQP